MPRPHTKLNCSLTAVKLLAFQALFFGYSFPEYMRDSLLSLDVNRWYPERSCLFVIDSCDAVTLLGPCDNSAPQVVFIVIIGTVIRLIKLLKHKRYLYIKENYFAAAEHCEIFKALNASDPRLPSSHTTSSTAVHRRTFARSLTLPTFQVAEGLALPAATASFSLRFTAPLLTAEHFRLLAFRCGTACHRRLRRRHLWQSPALDSRRFWHFWHFSVYMLSIADLAVFWILRSPYNIIQDWLITT